MAGHDADIVQQTNALRALARGLLCDAHAAEDVVQDAWVAALQRDARPANPFAWMAGTTRRLVARTLRRRGRQRRREQVAARAERVPSAETLAAEAEILKGIAAAVAALEEPYRAAIVMRYYRGLAPVAIAATLGVPVATVKTRVRRGLAMLRARMDRERGSSAWALALASIPVRGKKALAWGGVWMSAKAKVTVALTAATVLLLTWWAVGTRGAGDMPRSRANEAGHPAGVARAEADPPRDEEHTPDGLWGEVIVEDPDGRPVDGAEVSVAPLERWSNTAKTRTGVDGRARLPVEAAGMFQVNAVAADFVPVGVFRQLPGTIRIRLRRGCRLKLRPVPWPDPAWADFRWFVQGEVHTSRVVSLGAPEIDAGVWPAGVVTVYHSPVGGGDMRSIAIALPESGEVVHELRRPERKFAEVVVEDAETGTLLHDWKAWSNASELAREKGDRFGAYRLYAAGQSIQVEAPGYARAFAALPREAKQPVNVTLRRGVALRVAFAPGSRPAEVAVYYNSPLRSWSTTSITVRTGPPPAGEELNLTEREWKQGNLLGRLDSNAGWRAEHLPPDSRLDIVARDEGGLFVHKQITTGEPGTDVTVELRWPDTERRTFVVRGEDGRPRADVEVRIADRRGTLGSFRTDGRGRGRVAGLRVGHEYSVETVYRGTRQRHELTDVLTVEEPRYAPRRVLVLDDTGVPVPGVRVQFGVRNGVGAFAVTGADGIAYGKLAAAELYLVAVQWEPGVNGHILFKPSPDEDPIVYRGDVGKIVVRVDLAATGLVYLRLRGGKREHERRVHVHGRGRARFHLPVEPGDYRIEATLDGRTVEASFAARAGEKLLVPVRFD